MLARKGAQVPRDLTDGATVKGKGPEGRGQPAREGPALSGADPGPRRGAGNSVHLAGPRVDAPSSGRPSLPLLNFPFPGSHHTFGNDSLLCFTATALTRPRPRESWAPWEPPESYWWGRRTSGHGMWGCSLGTRGLPCWSQGGRSSSASLFSFAGMRSDPHNALR